MKTLLTSVFLLVFIYSYSAASAAELSISSPASRVISGESFAVSVKLHSPEEKINAIQGKISFSSILELEDVRDGNSIISVWIEKPRLAAPELVFSGLIPGGYQGSNGLLVTLVFKAKEPGLARVSLQSSEAYESEGQNVQVVHQKPFTVEIATGTPLQNAQTSKDMVRPEFFRAILVASDDLFDGQASLIFAAHDKGSGIDRYEIKEGLFGEYKLAESPFVLADQTLTKKLYVRAIDNNGNTRTSVVYPPHWKPVAARYSLFILLGLLFVSAAYLKLHRFKS